MLSTQILEALRKLFPSELVLVKGTAEYDQSNDSYLSARESEISPSIIVRPRSKADVVSFIRIIKSSEYHDIKFAVRGAGQQPLSGCANIDGGITLDLSLLTGIVLEANSGVVSIAAGERWGAIYDKLDGTGLGIGGARSAKGGIGGLALAGGLSIFSSREGFICNNVENYEVVLASAEIINANAYSNADLFHALRGGGNNFGIVTRYDIRTFEQGRFWGGSIY